MSFAEYKNSEVPPFPAALATWNFLFLFFVAHTVIPDFSSALIMSPAVRYHTAFLCQLRCRDCYFIIQACILKYKNSFLGRIWYCFVSAARVPSLTIEECYGIQVVWLVPKINPRSYTECLITAIFSMPIRFVKKVKTKLIWGGLLNSKGISILYSSSKLWFISR